ncbi:MAG: hypothetical protein EXR92_01920 [Gemmatimonadetes bacterium]|nr:hypothetical protein [Gemmatimonadota bacterium]
MPTTDRPIQLLEERRRTLQQAVGRPLRTPAGSTGPALTAKGRRHLIEELEELYWNDLEWENVTEEERMEGGSLPELTFPGVLALVRGLLLTEVIEGSAAMPEPRPEVVEDFFGFLSGRILALRREAAGGPGEEGDRAALELRMTAALLDRALLEYHRLSPEDVGTLE